MRRKRCIDILFAVFSITLIVVGCTSNSKDRTYILEYLGDKFIDSYIELGLAILLIMMI